MATAYASGQASHRWVIPETDTYPLSDCFNQTR